MSDKKPNCIKGGYLNGLNVDATAVDWGVLAVTLGGLDAIADFDEETKKAIIKKANENLSIIGLTVDDIKGDSNE